MGRVRACPRGARQRWCPCGRTTPLYSPHCVCVCVCARACRQGRATENISYAPAVLVPSREGVWSCVVWEAAPDRAHARACAYLPQIGDAARAARPARRA